MGEPLKLSVTGAIMNEIQERLVSLERDSQELTAKIADLRMLILGVTNPSSNKHCCIKCLSWNYTKEFCEKYNMVPPPSTIVTGCKNFIDEVPF